MIIRATIEEAQEQLRELIAAAIRGDDVYIIANDGRAVKLVSVKAKREAGSARGLIEMSTDFDELLEDFKEYTE
jgi:antitoxin (DNA-binding transcriptional repressor) of toxin-antitoxin stability system